MGVYLAEFIVQTKSLTNHPAHQSVTYAAHAIVSHRNSFVASYCVSELSKIENNNAWRHLRAGWNSETLYTSTPVNQQNENRNFESLEPRP